MKKLLYLSSGLIAAFLMAFLSSSSTFALNLTSEVEATGLVYDNNDIVCSYRNQSGATIRTVEGNSNGACTITSAVDPPYNYVMNVYKKSHIMIAKNYYYEFTLSIMSPGIGDGVMWLFNTNKPLFTVVSIEEVATPNANAEFIPPLGYSSRSWRVVLQAQITDSESVIVGTATPDASTLFVMGNGLIYMSPIKEYKPVSSSASANSIVNKIDQQMQLQHSDAQNQLNESKKQTAAIEETKDFVTDTKTPDSSDIANSDTLPSVGLLPPGPLDSILLLPLNIMNSIVSSLGGNCTPIVAPLPFVGDQSLVFPCFSDTFYSGDWAPFGVLLGSVSSAFILYYYLKHLYKKVDRATSLETTDEDEWGIL